MGDLSHPLIKLMVAEQSSENSVRWQFSPAVFILTVSWLYLGRAVTAHNILFICYILGTAAWQVFR